jgi:hypothetical protein
MCKPDFDGALAASRCFAKRLRAGEGPELDKSR